MTDRRLAPIVKKYRDLIPETLIYGLPMSSFTTEELQCLLIQAYKKIETDRNSRMDSLKAL